MAQTLLGKNILASSAEREQNTDEGEDDDGEMSPLEHLAKSTLGLRWQDAIFGIFGVYRYTAYFDRSGQKPQHRCTVVAGWVAPVGNWNTFENGWKDVLKEFEVPYLHMKKLAHFKEPFDKWKDKPEKRTEFLKRCVEVIRSSKIEFNAEASIPHEVFAAVNRRYKLTSVFKNEFVLAARECAERANGHLIYSGVQPKRPDAIEYIFDQGEKGIGAVLELFAADGLSTPSFKPSRDDPKTGREGVVQLQAADFLTYEWFKVSESVLNSKWPFPETRKSFGALYDCVTEKLYHEYSEFDVERICEKRGIAKRTPKENGQ